MAIFKCKMCGGTLEVRENESVCVCDFCGTQQTIATTQDEVLQGLFNRANILRMKSEFDKAESLYEKIIQTKPDEAEAYWGLILCRYGIEYVEDPKTFKRIPTCHRTSVDSVIADPDYKAALQYADLAQRAIYEAEAKEIDRLQKEILALSQKEDPYDVFICYKETDESGRRTPDSVIANDIYHQLTQEGFKVFYAAISLENKLGSAYEPCIFAALNSAKVMLVVGTKPEYFNAVWVKNEWSRYLKLMKTDRSRILIPCYRDMDAYELPEEFAHLQAQDMSKIGFINDVVRGIKKVLTNLVAEPSVPVERNSFSVESLLERVRIFLDVEEWSNALDYCEKVLDLDPKNEYAYIYALFAANQVSSFEKLSNISSSNLQESSYYKKAFRFASDENKEKLDRCRKQSILNGARIDYEKAESEEQYLNVYHLCKSIIDYKDAEKLARESLQQVSSMCHKEIDQAQDLMNAYTKTRNNIYHMNEASQKKIDSYKKEIDAIKAEKNQREKGQGAKAIVLCVLAAVVSFILATIITRIQYGEFSSFEITGVGLSISLCAWLIIGIWFYIRETTGKKKLLKIGKRIKELESKIQQEESHRRQRLLERDQIEKDARSKNDELDSLKEQLAKIDKLL